VVMSFRSKWAAGKAVRAGLAVEGAYLNRYVTDPAAAGLARPVWIRYGHFARALKNSQLTCGDITIICGTVHEGMPRPAECRHQLAHVAPGLQGPPHRIEDF
jgi:hypothetical protein